ncbi:MAG: DUF4333 domain-containing protein [Gordonia sp. (in: high G+C Gram-positive bacteria)]|uniref:DUF4333 domain-containing protein n=1 Tax=Gordonia sp. (in: high G+C Gram-positive bacteria) TaxID=84139 RepID=UPI0039E4B2B5
MILLLTAYVWPKWAGPMMSQTAVQDGVVRILTDRNHDVGYGITGVTDVACPSGQPAKAGHAFTCTVTVDGEKKHVKVIIENDKYQYSVSKPQD